MIDRNANLREDPAQQDITKLMFHLKVLKLGSSPLLPSLSLFSQFPLSGPGRPHPPPEDEQVALPQPPVVVTSPPGYTVLPLSSIQ